jgi:hypothetical protein
MKKSIVTLIGVGVFILLCVLTLRPVNTPDNESELLVAEGELTRVFEGTGKDIIFKLKNDDRSFYINRGLEQGLSIKELQARLTGKQITLKFPKHWTLLDPTGKTKHLSMVKLREETVFSELN